MFAYRRASVMHHLLVFLCAVAVIGGAFLHDIIPHHDGIVDDHGQTQESPIWRDLHSVLQHEKKSFFLLTENVVPIIFSLFVPIAVLALLVETRAILFDPVRGVVLRRGLSPDRAFR